MENCALCFTGLPKQSIRTGDKEFCCFGCETVFTILSSQNALQNYSSHPLFQQAVKAGLISNPLLLEKLKPEQTELPQIEKECLHLEIQGMWCPSCSEVIPLFLLQKKGIFRCSVDYTTDLAQIEYSPRDLSKADVMEAIEALGYFPTLLEDREEKNVNFHLYLRFIVAAFCTLNIMMFSYPIYASYFDKDSMGYSHLFAWISFFSTLPVVSYCAWPMFHRFAVSLRVGYWGMEALVVIGSTAAFSLSVFELLNGTDRIYFDSLSAIITFVLLGKIIETKAKYSAKSTIFRLTKGLPKRGRKRLSDGSLIFVPIKEILPGDTVVVFSGEKIVVDGVSLEGEGTCDESLITGEPLPVLKEAGDRLIAGSILCQGTLAVRVTASTEQSTLHQIISLVNQEMSSKPIYKRTIDSILRWFVPVVIVLACFCASFYWTHGNEAILRAVSVLLIACPCAIGIAGPLAESHAMNRLASIGAIVKNRKCLSLLGKETVFVFDKTGTITEGRFTVIDGLRSLSEVQLSILKGLASQSTHPISITVNQALKGPSIFLTCLEEIPGKGLRGKYEEKEYYLGSKNFLKQIGIFDISEPIEEKAIVSHVFFGCDKQLLACIALQDQVREGVSHLISQIKPAKTILLSGDSQPVVDKVALKCGFDEWYWGFNPLEKRNKIDQLRSEGHTVCMVGDGINDAPALAGAHIGISVLSATDISANASDLLLTTDSLSVVVKIGKIGRMGQRILKQNLFWAFSYNVIGLGLALMGTLSPLFAAFAMMLSSTIVLFNSRRMDRIRIKFR